MKRKIVPGILFLLLSVAAWCQAQNDHKETLVTEKARYLKEDINTFLTKTTRYSKENITNRVQGDIIVSFTINKEGKMDNLAVESATEPSLVSSAFSSLSQVSANNWRPAKVNNVPVDSKYKIVFRFRQFVNEAPFDYLDKAKRLFDKEKYDKALKTCDSGIEDNQFDAALYELRSQVKKKMGDMEGGQLDDAIAATLNGEVLTVVNIYVTAKTRTVTTTSITSTPHLRH